MLITENLLRKKWHANRLGYHSDGLAGDEAFFDYLDQTLALSHSEEVAERLVVYYLCIGLGFQGFYFNQPNKLREYMRSIQARSQYIMGLEGINKLVPQAYEHTNTKDFVRPPKENGILLLLALLFLLLTAVSLYFVMYNSIRKEISPDMYKIIQAHQGTRKSLETNRK